MTHVNPSLSQAGFRGYADDGGEGAATPKAAENTGWTQAVDETFRVRFVVDETAGGTESNITLQLQYNLNGAGFVNVTGSSSVVRAVASTHITEEGATTRQLTSGSGTFVTGAFDEDDGLAGEGTQIDFGSGGELTEVEYSVQILSADVADSDTITLRVIRSSGTALENYAQTPSLTVSEAGGGQNVDVGLATETDSALPITVTKRVAVGLAVETDSALAVTVDPLLYETFEGTGYEVAGWSENPNTGTLDEDFATSGISGGVPSGWGDQCFRLVRPGGEANKSTSPDFAAVSDGYFNFDILPVSETLADGQDKIICSVATNTAGILVVYLRQVSGALRLRFSVATGSGGAFTDHDWTTDINLGQRYIAEFHWVASTGYEIWVDGTSIFSGSTAFAGEPVDVGLGANDTTAGGVEVLFDRVYASKIRRLAPPPAGPTVGQAVETDTAFPLTAQKSEPTGQAVETDTALGITASKQVPVGLATETDSAFAVGHVRTEPVGLATESDIALQIAPSKVVAAGVAQETDTAHAFTVTKAPAVGLATETDIALPIVPTKAQAVALAIETDAALPITVSQGSNVPVGLATEADSAFPVTVQKAVAVSQAQETDTALPITARKSVPIGQAQETDTAQAIAVQQGNDVPVGQAVETDTALPVTIRKSVAVGLAVETNTARPVVVTRTIHVGQAVEMDTVPPVTATKSQAVGIAVETDTAFDIGVGQGDQVPVGQAVEVDSAFAVGVSRVQQMGVAAEQDQALPITATKVVPVGQAQEADLALGVAYRRLVAVGQAVEQDTVFGVTATRVVDVGMAVEVDTALPLVLGVGEPRITITVVRPSQATLGVIRPEPQTLAVVRPKPEVVPS